MQTALDVELAGLVGDLARMSRLAGQSMINASAALLQADTELAALVVNRVDQLDCQYHHLHQRCTTLLARSPSGAPALSTVEAVWHAVDDLQRMGELAQRTAKIVRFAHTRLAVPNEVCTLLAQMGLLASGMACQAASVIENPDPLSGDRLGGADDEVGELRRQLFRIVFAESWSYGRAPAVQAALVGRYFECFADHAVAIARQIQQSRREPAALAPRSLSHCFTTR